MAPEKIGTVDHIFGRANAIVVMNASCDLSLGDGLEIEGITETFTVSSLMVNDQSRDKILIGENFSFQCERLDVKRAKTKRLVFRVD